MAMGHMGSPTTVKEMIESINNRDNTKKEFVIKEIIRKIYYAKSNHDFSLDAEAFVNSISCTQKILLDAMIEVSKVIDGYSLEIDGQYIILTKDEGIARPYDN